MTTLAAAASTGHPWDQAAHGWNRHTMIIHAWLEDATRGREAMTVREHHRAAA